MLRLMLNEWLIFGCFIYAISLVRFINHAVDLNGNGTEKYQVMLIKSTTHRSLRCIQVAKLGKLKMSKKKLCV